MKPVLNLIKMQGVPIMRQLQLEEALFRVAKKECWCIVNSAAPTLRKRRMQPTVVMGVSGKAYEHLNVDLCRERKVPVIRRYSGGGTVVVDNDTFLVTFIMTQEAEPGVVCFPRCDARTCQLSTATLIRAFFST